MHYKPKELQFYGHETFPLRHLWLPKAINHIREDHNLSDSFSVMAEQGLGKNMAKSMKHWAESTKVVDKTRRGHLYTYTISDMGELIFSDKGDRYLQYSDTIWLLHYLMVTNHKKNALWYYLFNCFSSEVFTKDSFINSLKAWLARIEYPSIPNTKQLERDFNCCMNMYCLNESKRKRSMDEYFTSPFNQLQLISENKGEYRLRRMSSLEISKEMFSFCLLDYLKNYPKNSDVPFSEIQHGEKSPGKVFNIVENTLVEYLESFEKMLKGTFEFESTAGMKTLFLMKEFPINYDKYLKKAFAIVS